MTTLSLKKRIDMIKVIAVMETVKVSKLILFVTITNSLSINLMRFHAFRTLVYFIILCDFPCCARYHNLKYAWLSITFERIVTINFNISIKCRYDSTDAEIQNLESIGISFQMILFLIQ